MIWLHELLLAAKLIAIVAAILGWGCVLAFLVARLLRIEPSPDGRAIILYGLYLTILFSQLAPFFGPVGQRSGLAWEVAGCVLFAMRIRYCARAFGGARCAFMLLVALLIGMLVASVTISVSYDAGLYQFQFVKWMVEHGTVFGLANMHGRLGFNSAWLTAAALFSSADGLASDIAAWQIAVIFLLWAGLLWRGLCALEGGSAVSGSFGLVVSAMTLVFPGERGLTMVASNDGPTTLVICHAFAAALAYRETKNADSWVLLACCIALALVLKVSSAPIALLLFAGSLRAWLDVTALRRVLIALAVIAALLGVWIAQNVALSGCLVYPAEQSCLHLPWSVDASLVASEAQWISSWARAPGHALDDPILRDLAWLEPWTSLRKTFLVQFAVLLALAAGAAILMPVLRRPHAPLAIVGPPMVVAIAGIAFWSLMAPDPRFGAGFIVSLPALVVARSVFALPRCLVVAVFFTFAVYALSRLEKELINIIHNRNAQNLAVGLSLPYSKVEMKVTSHGIPIAVTIGGDQCWLAELPCTPYFRINLGESKIGSYRMYYAGD